MLQTCGATEGPNGETQPGGSWHAQLAEHIRQTEVPYGLDARVDDNITNEKNDKQDQQYNTRLKEACFNASALDEEDEND